MKKLLHLFKKKIIPDSSGFTLIEMAVVLVIVGIIISIVATVLPSLIKSSRVKKARALQEKVDYAIQGYVAANGRLPFADKGTLGKEDSQTPTYFGNLPFITLGLSSGDDAWGKRFKYGVNKDLTTTNAGNFGVALKTACSDDPVNPDKLYVNINGTLTHMAYVIVSGGLKDEDGIRGLFDGLNGVDDAVFDDPNRIIESDVYDDLMVAKACTVLAGSQGYGSGSGSGSGSSTGTLEDCTNGTDDDGDGHIDCDDQDCYNISPCGSGTGNLSISTTSIPSGYVNSSYSATFQATGGTTPYEWTLTEDGSFSSLFLHTYLGQLSGTLDQCPGTYTISAQVKDSDTENDPDPSPSNFTIQVKTNMSVSRTSGSGVDITWGSVTQQETFQASGGHLGDIEWTLDTGGATGFSVSSTGSDTCTVKKDGISSIGSFTFTLTATDASCAGNTAQIILSVSVLSSGGGAPYTVDLSSEWRMDECSWDGTTGEVKDSGAGGLDGTAKNGTNTVGSGKVCSAGYFDGINDYLDMGDILNNVFGSSSNSFSVAAWIRPASLSSSQTNHNTRNCFAAKASDSINDNFEIGVNTNGTIHVYIDTAGQDKVADFGVAGSVAVNVWSFVVVTYDNGSVAVTINDNRYENTSTWSGGGNIDNAAGSLFTIGSSQHIDNYFTGKIDEVMVYSKALTAEEITSLYTLTHTCSGTCYTEPLAVYYMDESTWNVGTADEVKDSSGNSYHGTPYGGAAINTTDSHIGYSGELSSGTGTIEITGLPVSTSSGDQTTVTFWMKWLGGNSQMPIGWTTYDLWFASDNFGFNTGQSDIYGVTGASAKLANNWHYIAAIFTNSGTTQNSLFIDGVEQSLSTVLGSSHGNRTVGSNFRISGWTNTSTYKLNGLMDELRIYKRGLSASEIAGDKDLTH
jgi:prepilin-type N-terminal cleavage/methylation domain-containing protein